MVKIGCSGEVTAITAVIIKLCWDSYRIKINDIPEDSILVNKTTEFLNDKGINLAHYGEAKIDNNWRLNYETSTDKANYYIPEEVSAIYPFGS